MPDHGIRSLLFVPAEERRLAKVGRMNADAYIIDLEDSIGEDRKDEALRRTVGFLKAYGPIDNLFVRINKERRLLELDALKPYPVGIMLPKIETCSDYSDMENALNDKPVIALIETPRALYNAGTIAATPWIDTLAFGAEDFTAAASMRNSWDNLFVFKSLLSLAAKTHGKRVYDTPCFHLADETLFNSELEQAVDLGFNGKLAIHPKQIDKINLAFLPHDRDYMQYLVSVYESSGKAVCEIDGTVYEKMHIDRMRRMLALTDCGKE